MPTWAWETEEVKIWEPRTSGGQGLEGNTQDSVGRD